MTNNQMNKIWRWEVVTLLIIMFFIWLWTIFGEYGEQRDIKIKNRVENNQVETL